MIGIQWREQTSGHLQPLEKNSRANTHFTEYQAQLLVFSFTCDTTQTYSLLFFLLFSVQYLRYFCRFIKEWRKNPQWSLSCCLALLLPLNDLQNEIREMTGKHFLEDQLQTGTFNMPSVSSTLKESGAVSFELATIHEQSKESVEPRSVNLGYEESDNGGLEEEDAVKVAFDTRKESGAVSFELVTIHVQPKESVEPRSVNFSFEEGDNGGLEEEDADKVAFDTRKESGAARFELATIHVQSKESVEPRSVNFGIEEGDNGGLKEEDADKVAFDARKESGAVSFELATIHVQPKESVEPRSVNFGIEEGDNGGLKEEDADKVAFDARKESGAVSFELATIHVQPKESVEPRSVNFGYEESDNGGLEEEDADKVAFDTRKESGVVSFKLATIHVQSKESVEPRSVNFDLEEGDNGGLKEEDADKVAFDTRKESGVVSFELATIHVQPKESVEPRSVNFGYEESDNDGLEEEDANKVALDTRKESGAVSFELATIHVQPKESVEPRSVNFGYEESDNDGLEEEDANKVAFDTRKESGAVSFELATIHVQPKESVEPRSVDFGYEESDNGGLEEEDADKVAFDRGKKLNPLANPKDTFHTHF